MTDHLLEQPYGADHPLHLDGPAGAAVLATATAVLDGHYRSEDEIQAGLIDQLCAAGGTHEDLLALIDAGSFRSARHAWALWQDHCAQHAADTTPAEAPATLEGEIVDEVAAAFDAAEREHLRRGQLDDVRAIDAAAVQLSLPTHPTSVTTEMGVLDLLDGLAGQ